MDRLSERPLSAAARRRASERHRVARCVWFRASQKYVGGARREGEGYARSSPFPVVATVELVRAAGVEISSRSRFSPRARARAALTVYRSYFLFSRAVGGKQPRLERERENEKGRRDSLPFSSFFIYRSFKVPLGATASGAGRAGSRVP